MNTTKTTEHSLILHSNEVRAFLDERQTQMRRVYEKLFDRWNIGDKLLGKEQWAEHEVDDVRGTNIFYKADDPFINARWRIANWESAETLAAYNCRIILKITANRQEHLQDISEADAIAQGMCGDAMVSFRDAIGVKPHSPRQVMFQVNNGCITVIEQFRKLWDAANPKHPWSTNPLVQVFEVVRETR